mmetsp:Transcript_26649/g.41803  ORF Transcript_26649/g.41803 Transcript_26649/m.41803 type:complete len:575 (-) Transcript_26649:95-1819(-)
MKSMQILEVLVLLCGIYIFVTSGASTNNDSNNVCNTSDDPNCDEGGGPPLSQPTRDNEPLRPSDLPQPVVFSAFESNRTVTLKANGVQQAVAEGNVQQINKGLREDTDGMVNFAVLPSVVNRADIQNVLSRLESFEKYNQYDDDPDSVDGMTSHEIFINSPELDHEQSMKFRDTDPNFLPARRELRQQLNQIMSPYINSVITPMVHARYPEACNITSKGPGRVCTPCYSLVRKYKHGQRQSHGTHHDHHALVTVVISLSDYNVNYKGGLYVASGVGQREFLALNKGDAVMHQSSLLHGVQVYDIDNTPKNTERWSWILWYKDSTKCDEDYGYEWFKDCSDEGNALCQQLHSTKVGMTPGISQEENAKAVLDLNMKAADGGSAFSAIKVARAYLGTLPSSLSFDVQKAVEYYGKAIQSNHPDGHYGMAQILLMAVMNEYSTKGKEGELTAWKDPRIKESVQHLEQAAYLGSAFAMFNLGVVHTFGYHNTEIDGDLAGKWFEASGLPEGYFVAANQAGAVGDMVRYETLLNRAKTMGYGTPWREHARKSTGSGGAAGVDLNLPWPPAFDGRRPPTF